MHRKNFTRALAAAVIGLGLAGASAAPAFAATTFAPSFRDDGKGVVTLPLRAGLRAGETVYFVVLDASTAAAAQKYGVNRSDKLANARRSVAVQKVDVVNGVIVFPASVDFSPERVVVPGPDGFPPAQVQPGAFGEPGYSPLIELPDGTILNAPHVANASGLADKVVNLDEARGSVTLTETDGYANGKRVLYVSTDASDFLAAALEGATYAPQLAFLPGLGDDSTASPRTALGATINGQTGLANPNRQGFRSALLDGDSPRNVLAWTPNQGRYSPMWDVHLAQWSDAAVAQRANRALTDFDDFAKAADAKLLTGPGGAKFGAVGIVVNCPIIRQVP